MMKTTAMMMLNMLHTKLDSLDQLLLMAHMVDLQVQTRNNLLICLISSLRREMAMAAVKAMVRLMQSRMNNMPVPVDRTATSAPVQSATAKKVTETRKPAATVTLLMLLMPSPVSNVANTSVDLMMEPLTTVCEDSVTAWVSAA